MTDPLIARLRALLVEWRQRARYSSHFADWHPRAAQDVKDAAVGEGFAFGACADELAILLVDMDAAQTANGLEALHGRRWTEVRGTCRYCDGVVAHGRHGRRAGDCRCAQP